MSLAEGNKILASDLIALKNRVKAEMAKRCRNGDVSSYATDYTNIPESGKLPLPSHLNEIITPMSEVNTVGVSTVSTGSLLDNIDTIDAKLTVWEAD